MKNAKRVDANLDDVQFGYWDGEKEEFIPLESATPENAKLLGVSELFLDAIIMLAENIKEEVRKDLIDIWEKASS